MRATTLRIHGFGRLRDREFAFGPGLTIVHGRNEAGKSTLHTALAASAFGLVPGGRKSPKHTAVIERHRPWQGERYATTLELERGDGHALRIDWDYDRGQFAVTDTATGADRTSDHGAGTNPDVLSETLYDVGRDVYLRVGCVGQEELARIEGEAADVREAIERAAGQAQSDSSSAAAVERLRGRRKQLVGLNRSQTNPLPRAEAQAQRLRGELSEAIAARAEAEALSAERDEAAEHTRVLERRIRGLEFALEGARWRSLKAMVERAEGVERELVAATATVRGSAQVANGFRPVPGIDGARERYQQLLGQRQDLDGQREQAQRELDALLATPPPVAEVASPSPAGWIVAGIGVVAALAGLAVSVLLVVAGVVAIVAGAALATVARPRATPAARSSAPSAIAPPPIAASGPRGTRSSWRRSPRSRRSSIRRAIGSRRCSRRRGTTPARSTRHSRPTTGECRRERRSSRPSAAVSWPSPSSGSCWASAAWSRPAPSASSWSGR